MTTAPSPLVQEALRHLRTGDQSAALNAAEKALAANPDETAAHALVGLLWCQQGVPAKGIPHLRHALEHWPDDLATRVNLATALAGIGATEEVAALCMGATTSDLRLQRLMGYVHQQRNELREAASCYEAVVSQMRQDYESWNNLGNIRTELGDVAGAIEAYEWALTYRPDLPILYINLAKSLARTDRRKDRQKVMREGAVRVGDQAEILLQLGLAEAGMQDFDAAKQAYRRAIEIAPDYTSAYVELGLLLENLNETEELAKLVQDAMEAGLTGGDIDFIRAWSLRRKGRIDEALLLAAQVPDTIDPVRRAQLIADLADRSGDPARAFAAYGDMNRAAAEQLPVPPDEIDYRSDVAAVIATLSAEKVGRWRPVTIEAVPPSPVFLAGFPRSGTTLLDTLLMNDPGLHVTEEMPMMRQPEMLLGDPERIATIDTEEANRLRRRYFETLREIAPPPRPGLTVVDKYPLHLARAPLIHRLFPDAKIIMVKRHPCDVVLSCFMANFHLNRAMRHFGTLESAAQLYHQVLTAWTKARELLPLDVHVIRYERMVEDLEGEMRALLSFIGLPWTSQMLDNQASASRRSHIRTASYSQVTEPIYRRASGRWERYRTQMEPVLPILAPWAERMGYSI